MPGRRDSDAHLRLVHLSSGSEHAARGARARPRSDIDDASLAVREGGRGRVGFAAERPLLCLAADRLPHGPVWTRPPCPSRRCRLRRSVGPILFRLSLADVWLAAVHLCCQLILPLAQVDDMPEQTVRRPFDIADLGYHFGPHPMD